MVCNIKVNTSVTVMIFELKVTPHNPDTPTNSKISILRNEIIACIYVINITVIL